MTTGIPKPIWKLLKKHIDNNSNHKKRFSRLYNIYVDLYIQYLYKIHGRKFKDTLYLPSVLKVSPDSIKYANDPGFLFKLDNECDVLGGRWDKSLPLFSEQFPLEAFYDHFDEGIPWEETTMTDYLSDMFIKDMSWSGYNSFPEAWARLWKIDKLYDTIDSGGYKSQKELQDLTVDDPIGLPDWQDPAEPENHEVAVSISRSGEFIFEDGRHRLAIAKVLDIDKIPVYVVVRHKKWYDHLHSVKKNSSGINCDHPDIIYTINKC